MKMRFALLVACAGTFVVVHAPMALADFGGGSRAPIAVRTDKTGAPIRVAEVGPAIAGGIISSRSTKTPGGSKNGSKSRKAGGGTHTGSPAEDVTVCRKVLYEDAAKKRTWKTVCKRQ